jgi:ABC-type phosphate/phosphonate transport system substrate-binding protein
MLSHARVIRLGVNRAHLESISVSDVRGFAAVLEARLRQPMRTIFAHDDDHLLEGVRVGGVDVAWMPPSLHIRAQRANLVAVSERRGETSYRSALLVRSDSPVTTVHDLRNARVMWTRRGSASGCVVPRLHLQAAGFDLRLLKSESFAGSISTALDAVVERRADLCACYVREAAGSDPARARADVYRSLPAAAWQLRILALSESIPADGVVFSAAMDEALQARTRDVLLGLHDSRDGALALQRLLNAERLAPVTPLMVRAMERFRTRTAV